MRAEQAVRTGRARRRPPIGVGLGLVLAVSALVAQPPAVVDAPPFSPTALTTWTLRPDGDVLRQWSGTPGPAWSSLDDALSQPAPADASDYIYAGGSGRVTETTLTTAAFTAATGQITPWFYANTGASTQLRVDVVAQGTVRATTTVAAGSPFAWRSIPAFSATQATANDLRLRFTTVTGGDSNVRAAYANLAAENCGPDCGWQQDWSAAGENLADWSSLQMPAPPKPARLSSATPPVVKNGKALRAEVQDGDVAVNPAGQPVSGGWRAEAIGPTDRASAQPVRYTWSTLLDASYPATSAGVWQVISQWHQGDADLGGSPPVAFIVVGDQILLDLHHPDPARPGIVIQGDQVPLASLTRGTWHDFRVEIRWALSGGYVKVWHNNELKADEQNIATLYPTQADPAAPGTAILKMGLYRKAVTVGAPFVLYHDEVRRLRPL